MPCHPSPAEWIKPVLEAGEADGITRLALQYMPVRVTEDVNPRSDIALSINSFSDHLDVHMAGDSAIFARETVQRMSDCLRHMVQSLLSSPAALVEDSMGITPQESAVLSTFSAGKLRPEHLEGPLFHEAFAWHAAQHPDRICLVFEGVEMSYGQVSAAADSLARALIGMGVAPGSPVGIMLDRSFELLIAAIGVMKAGGGCAAAVPPSGQQMGAARSSCFSGHLTGLGVFSTQVTLQRCGGLAL